MTDNTSVNSSEMGKGEDTLLSLIYPTTKDDMSAYQLAEFALAAAEQTEYSSSGNNRCIARESVGDISVTYESAASPETTVCGEKIAPAALTRLLRCGLLSRWI